VQELQRHTATVQLAGELDRALPHDVHPSRQLAHPEHGRAAGVAGLTQFDGEGVDVLGPEGREVAATQAAGDPGGVADGNVVHDQGTPRRGEIVRAATVPRTSGFAGGAGKPRTLWEGSVSAGTRTPAAATQEDAMATIRHHAHIDRSPDEVWRVVADAGAISNWFPGIDSSSADGTTRRCSMGGAELVEEIVTVDDTLRRFQYRITEGPMPLDFHLGTVDVLPDGDGSLVIYSTEVSPDEAKAIVDGVIAGGVEGLKAALEA